MVDVVADVTLADVKLGVPPVPLTTDKPVAVLELVQATLVVGEAVKLTAATELLPHTVVLVTAEITGVGFTVMVNV